MTEVQITEQLKAERIQAKLKAERIQEKLRAERIQSLLKAERIQALLSDVPGWAVGEDGASLRRTYQLPSLRASGLFVQLVLEMGEQISYVPTVKVRSLEITVTISTVGNKGLTEREFDVARVLDSRF